MYEQRLAHIVSTTSVIHQALARIINSSPSPNPNTGVSNSGNMNNSDSNNFGNWRSGHGTWRGSRGHGHGKYIRRGRRYNIVHKNYNNQQG